MRSTRKPQGLAVRAGMGLAAALIAVTLFAGAQRAAAQGSRAYLLTLNGPLTPAQAAYLERALGQAQGPQTEVIILQLNTPGGDITLMQRMVALIRDSPAPVVVVVSPGNALARSAGTLVTLAGDASAMTPASVIWSGSAVVAQGQHRDPSREPTT